MVQCEFRRIDGGKIGLTMQGHSSYKEKGQLVVCAGISTLLYTLVAYLTNTFESKTSIFKLCPGDVDIESTSLGEEAFHMACIGFIQLGESYPGEISVTNGVWESRLCRIPAFDIKGFKFEEGANERA